MSLGPLLCLPELQVGTYPKEKGIRFARNACDVSRRRLTIVRLSDKYAEGRDWQGTLANADAPRSGRPLVFAAGVAMDDQLVIYNTVSRLPAWGIDVSYAPNSTLAR